MKETRYSESQIVKALKEVNEERPHDSLGDLTPYEYMVASKQPENSRSLCA